MGDRTMLSRYSLAHGIVDFACAFLVLRTMGKLPQLALCLLVYNFCAFALQMPLGLLADGWNRNGLLAALGCALVAGAYLPMPAVLAAAAAGVGNGMFHVGGGLEVLNGSGGRAGPLGVFISPGALGLYLGTLLGGGVGVPGLIPALFSLGAGALLMLGDRQDRDWPASHNAPVSLNLSRREAGTAALLTAVVVLRSYMGFNQALPWKGMGPWPLLLVLALVLGKAAGGILCDRLGGRRGAALSLGLATLCYLGSGIPVLGTLAVFLFNMTMPITLWAAARLMPGSKGFAFGLLTFALFLGWLPTLLGAPSLLTAPWANALAAAVSLALLLPGLKGVEEKW